MINAIGGLGPFIGLISYILACAFGIAYVIAGVLNKKKFKEICILYKEKFGNLPDAVVLFEDVNTFFVDDAYGIKMQFIFIPLLWNRSSILTKNDDNGFIRGLPKRLIGPFYAELGLGIICLIFCIIAGLLTLATKQHWL